MQVRGNSSPFLGPEGLEPPTFGLKGRYSTLELRAQDIKILSYVHPGFKFRP